MGEDNMVRKVGISYKQINIDTLDGEINVVERPVRECVRLFNIEDTSLLDDIQAVRVAAEKLLDESNIVPISEICEDNEKNQENMKNPDEENPSAVDDMPKISDKKKFAEKKRRTRKTEIENLKIENWKEPTEPRRPRPSHSNFGQMLCPVATKCDGCPVATPLMTMVNIGYLSSTAGSYCPEPEHDDGAGADGSASGCHEIVDWERCFAGISVGSDLDKIEPVFLM